MRFILLLLVALVALPLVFRLILIATHMAFGLIHLAILLAIAVFLVGLVRRLLLLR